MIKWLIHQLTRPANWGYGLFWSWNLIFLAFMLLGFTPTVLPDMITAIRTGDIPLVFPLFAAALILIPLTSVILALIFVRRSPGRLFALGYGIEGPLMILLAVRFFAVGEMTPAVALVMAVAGLGLLTFLWQILDRRIDDYGSLLTHLRALGLTFLLLTGFYAATWIAFYALPLTWAALTWIVETLISLPFYLFDLLESIRDFLFLGPFLITSSFLFFYSATLFVLMPLALPVLCFRAWRQGLQTLTARYGRAWAGAFTLVISLVCLGLLVQANHQPQHQAFSLLAEPPASPAEAEVLLAREETLRQGLLNAYLAPYRYFSAAGEVYHISDIYKDVLGLSSQQAGQVQRWYELVVRPLLYIPVESYEDGNRWENQALREEPLKAAELYESFFDQTIIEGERETIVQAVRSTWAVDQAQAAWQAVDDREVHLVRQELNVTEKGDWAELELYEVYENQTTQRQEVVYYFSLPESAVITGVWLGNSPDRESRFVYRVSPRGAAQALYRSEVRRNMDPALVEQLGPRQYRLRIFPVEPRTWNWEGDSRSTLQAGPQLHMWLTWRVLAQEQAWPLPRLAERRNIYWDAGSVRLVKGESLAADSENWLPETLPATGPIKPAVHRVDFSNGETVLIQPAAAGELPQLPDALRLAVVLDRSRTMVEQAVAVEAALARLGEVTDQEGSLELYLTASAYRGEAPSRVAWAEFDPANILYYGGQNGAELLVQFDQLHEGESYDAILVLTDGTGYELGEGELQVPVPAAPVWMVHLDGNFPLAYDDATLEAIQASGGGVTGSIEEALTRLAVALSARQIPSATLDVADGYTWLTLPTVEVEANFGDSLKAEPLDSGFTALAARRLILAEIERQRAGLSQLATLDQLHAIAIEHSLVSPYSSMIVLVNEAQERRLEELEAQADRFEREVEAVGETTPEFNVTGVPEPEEWLLLALAAGMLAWYGYGRLRPKLTA